MNAQKSWAPSGPTTLTGPAAAGQEGMWGGSQAA